MDITPLKHGVIDKKIAEGSHATIHHIKTSSHDLVNRIVKIGKTYEYSPPFLHNYHKTKR